MLVCSCLRGSSWRRDSSRTVGLKERMVIARQRSSQPRSTRGPSLRDRRRPPVGHRPYGKLLSFWCRHPQTLNQRVPDSSPGAYSSSLRSSSWAGRIIYSFAGANVPGPLAARKLLFDRLRRPKRKGCNRNRWIGRCSCGEDARARDEKVLVVERTAIGIDDTGLLVLCHPERAHDMPRAGKCTRV